MNDTYQKSLGKKNISYFLFSCQTQIDLVPE
jgi:hypothetical protein